MSLLTVEYSLDKISKDLLGYITGYLVISDINRFRQCCKYFAEKIKKGDDLLDSQYLKLTQDKFGDSFIKYKGLFVNYINHYFKHHRHSLKYNRNKQI